MKVPKSSTVVREIPIEMIPIDPMVKARFQQSEETIFRYSQSLAKGNPFPPIDVFELGDKYLLADGGHRLEAYRLEGRDTIPARIHQGGRKEALIFASGANVKHGLLRNNNDKHLVVENVLKDPELGQWSNNKIADICAVSQPFVGKVREKLTCNGFKFESVRVSSRGRKMNTANIGQKRPQAIPEAEANPEVPSPENQEAQPTQSPSTEMETGVANGEDSVSDEGGTPQGVEPKDGSHHDTTTRAEEPKLDDKPKETPVAPPEEPSTEDPTDGEGGAPEDLTPEIDEVIALKTKVATLQEALRSKEIELQEKDSRISELEADNDYNIGLIKAYEKEEWALEVASKYKAKRAALSSLHA